MYESYTHEMKRPNGSSFTTDWIPDYTQAKIELSKLIQEGFTHKRTLWRNTMGKICIDYYFDDLAANHQRKMH